MIGLQWRRTCLLGLLTCLLLAGCTGAGYTPAQDEQIGPVHTGSDGGDSGGSSM